jgi:hypothetical protein
MNLPRTKEIQRWVSDNPGTSLAIGGVFMFIVGFFKDGEMMSLGLILGIVGLIIADFRS